MIVEGMHRCCTIALMAKDKKFLNSDIFIALSQFSIQELVEVINRSKDK